MWLTDLWKDTKNIHALSHTIFKEAKLRGKISKIWYIGFLKKLSKGNHFLLRVFIDEKRYDHAFKLHKNCLK